jgi:hypothetical protein
MVALPPNSDHHERLVRYLKEDLGLPNQGEV